MKKTALVLHALIAGLGLMLACRVTAQTFTTLHSLAGSDGANPYAGLVLTNNTLYGTSSGGGSAGNGTVFAVNADGTGFTNLHNFTATSGALSSNSDGAAPYAGLILSGNTLYGTTYQGGSSGVGTVFAISTDGTGFTNLHSFTAASDGANPRANLLLSANTLYGTARYGGSSGRGTVFKVNTDGTGFTNLHSFAGYPSDGSSPFAGLTLSGDILYGVTQSGGSVNYGTVFKINTDGTGFTNLFRFNYGDGIQPQGALILSGDTLYGTANEGGGSGQGTVFAVNTDGTGFTNLHSFTARPAYGTNSDGAQPKAGLILSGNMLYGTAYYGGSSANGTLFAVNTNGTSFTNLHNFAAGIGTSSSVAATNSEGVAPRTSLILSGNTLYGTAYTGGTAGKGTVFSLSFAPQLTITPSGGNVVMSWPTNFAGFDYAGFNLQSAPAIIGSFTNLPSATSPYTNPILGAQQFFRLILD